MRIRSAGLGMRTISPEGRRKRRRNIAAAFGARASINLASPSLATKNSAN
jgi:hypothetical protein